MTTTISAAVICKDEEDHIEECLQSVSWCDEIVVVDSGSTDRTVELARKHAHHVIHNEWPGYVAQKNFALEKTTSEWTLCLDADERCTPEVEKELKRECSSHNPPTGFEVRRHTHYLNRWINHGGWYPNWKLRVIRKGQGQWKGTDPHDKLIAEGEVKRLDAEIVHYTYRDFAQQIETINHFSDVVVQEWKKSGKKPSLLKTLFHPPIKFLECYVWKRGFLDGRAGFVIAVASAFYIFAKYTKLWEKRKDPKN